MSLSSSVGDESPEHVNWLKTLQHTYPGSIREESFTKSTHIALGELGFLNSNTLACVSVCRDEMCLPFLDLVDSKWKSPFVRLIDDGTERVVYTHTFILSSLAGILLLGKTGIGAAISHSVKSVDGRQRFIFYTLPHIGVSSTGVIGEVERPGFVQLSHACGALVKLYGELQKGPLNLDFDPVDIEYTFLKQRIAPKLGAFKGAPSLKDLTELTHQVIIEDLEQLISLSVDKSKCDYAVLTGTLIHAPNGHSYVHPGKIYAVVHGREVPINYKAHVKHHHHHSPSPHHHH